jgi:hypothetical protein
VWIVPANAMHTIGMLFAFDLVLLDKNFKVVGVRELVRPFRITMPERKAESVLELPTNTIFRSRTQISLISMLIRSKPLATSSRIFESTPRSIALRAAWITAAQDAIISKQPLFPQQHNGPFSSTVICPNSARAPAGVVIRCN